MSAIDPNRLARAVHLDCDRISLNQYLVTGGTADHVVTVQDGRVWCHCIDSQWKGDNCKHSLVTRLTCGDPLVAKALRMLVPRPHRAARAA